MSQESTCIDVEHTISSWQMRTMCIFNKLAHILACANKMMHQHAWTTTGTMYSCHRLNAILLFLLANVLRQTICFFLANKHGKQNWQASFCCLVQFPFCCYYHTSSTKRSVSTLMLYSYHKVWSWKVLDCHTCGGTHGRSLTTNYIIK